jgi:EAL domain-containing protein (putative c-di-GMP-specific phosphodiesterase class I)
MPRVAVNLSALQLRQPDIVMQVRNVLSETRLDPQRLEIEVTEGAIMHEPMLAQQTLQQLRELGIRIAIDDFGTGYSSLSYIKNFPADVVKIDRSFLAGVQTDGRASKLYQAIVDMARSLSLYIVAEGVEVREDLDFVRRSGCHAIQGYHFGMPMSADQAAQVMQGQSVSPVPVLDDAVGSRLEPRAHR